MGKEVIPLPCTTPHLEANKRCPCGTSLNQPVAAESKGTCLGLVVATVLVTAWRGHPRVVISSVFWEVPTDQN